MDASRRAILRMINSMTLIAALILSFYAASARAIEVLTAKALVGTWQLMSFEIVDSVGSSKSRPWCQSPWGILTYTDQGYMSAGINCMGQSQPKNPTDDPKDMVFYAGTYEIKNDGLVLHKVSNSSDITRIGKIMERHVSLQEDILTITAVGVKGPVRLVWKRAKVAAP